MMAANKVPTNAREAGVMRLQKAIRRHVRAQIDLSWKGGGPPEDIPGIEQEAMDAAVDLGYVLQTLVIYENNSRWDSQFQRLRTARERKALGSKA
jgi:hypothetical protein